MTVFYANAGGASVGYAILSGSAPAIHGGVVHVRQGTSYHLLSAGGAAEVAWLRQGHLCVVSGRGVSPSTLLALASWNEAGDRA
jgi:hypothetical protein